MPPPPQKFVPLKDVDITAVLEGAYATVNVDMVYANPSAQQIECEYEFPLHTDIILS